MFINFCDIPGHQNLFLDYLYEFENVKDYFAHNFRNKDSYLKIFKAISESKQSHYSQLSSIIQNQYEGLESSELTRKNILSLANKKTLAIVTGQQLGILGGPLYTFYKIITAIKLSEHLSERYDDFDFVPVFWLEGDDHDFNEVRTITTIDEQNKLITIGYSEEVPEDEIKQSVGRLKFDQSIEDFINKFSDQLRNTEFKETLVNNLKSFYAEGVEVKAAFKKLVHSIFDESGLVIFDPQDKKVKELLKPVFKKELSEFRQYTDKLVHTSAELEERYHAQVKVKPVNLFYSLEEGRYSIEPVENDFRLKRKRKNFTLEQILELVESEPENFSPNVLLRPICQDYLLPTAFYVGGPSEISYFAQIKPIYNFFGITQPIVYPRSSATILESSVKKSLDKYDLTINDIFIDVEGSKKKVIDAIAEISLNEVFKDINTNIEIAFDQLKEKLFQIDKTTADASKKYKEKIFNSLDELKQKAENAQSKRYDVTLRQIDKAATILFPESNLQERVLNFTYFVNKYGPEILNRLYNEIQIDKFEHQVIEI
jgi:bacillithiol synthase